MTEKFERRLPDGSWTTCEDNYVGTWNQLGTAVAKLFPGYWLGGYDPGIRLDKIGRLWKFRLSEIDGWVEADGAAEPDKDEAVGKP